ncbi:MAG: hypothetical protein HKP50_08915 [Myxococcales bacterium]|nr:hypothetical protein [Myxococcales bacterium]
MVELAEIFRDAGPAYLQRFGDRMLPSHKRVLHDIVACRTAALGGEMYFCLRCEIERSVYHSCRNRHCPKCQGHEAEKWLEKQRRQLLPCSYGFATFTVPAGLREVTRSHQRTAYPILLRAAAVAVLEVARDRRFIGGLTGLMAVLHTCSRTMIFHPHVHIVFPVGGLGDDGHSWIKPRKRKYILPSYAVSKIFRERVEREFRREGLYDLAPKKTWCRPWRTKMILVGTGEKVLLYLSRYLFRVAISNERILAYDGDRVTFKAKQETVTLGVEEFIRRFLQHVLPKNFVKVRYFGLWASACRPKLEKARTILQDHHAAIGKEPPRTASAEPAPRPAPRCPKCGCPYDRLPVTIPRSREPP